MTDPHPLLDRCATCGQPVPDLPRCPHCGADLALDVWVTAPVTDPRQAYLAARSVAQLALPGLGFAEAKGLLGRTGAPLAPALPRPQARALLAQLAGAGVPAEARPAMARSAASSALRRRPVLLGGLGLAAVIVATFAVIALRKGATAPPASSGMAGQAPLSPSPRADGPPPAVGNGPAAEPPPDSTPGVRAASPAPPQAMADLARRATPATAQVSCQGQTGAGFFVTPELLLTNAHVVCGQGVPLTIAVGDGRSLIGQLLQRDDWVDWAVVKVPGAGVTPLPLGDPTALSAADPVVLIGAPRGLGGTVHVGKVSYVGRTLHGLAYVQVNADVNPGNSGGPLLDGEGRAIGIVSLKIMGADGLGMALPIEYARAALPGLAPLPPEGQSRWEALLAKARAEDAAEVSRMREDLARPVLLDLRAAGPHAVSLVVMQRFQGRTSSARLALEVWDDGKKLCSPSAMVTDWIDLEKKVKELADPRTERRVAWLLHHDLLSDVHAGGTVAPLDGCPSPVPAGAKARLEWSDGDNAWTSVPPGLSGGRREEVGPDPGERGSARGGPQAQARSSEAEWRDAFAQVHQRIAQLESKREQYRRELAAPRSTSNLAEARNNLPELERQLKQAREQLDDLERQASRAGIPRAWR